MQVRLKAIAKGMATYVPGITRFANSVAGTWLGPRYYYAVWLRHLVRVHDVCGPFKWDVVAELGPGDALGVGISAILSGVRCYLGLDRIAFASTEVNLRLLEDILGLFSARAPIPDQSEFPSVYPTLQNYAFPHHILTSERLSEALEPARIERLRALIRAEAKGSPELDFRYVAPWDAAANVVPRSVDWVLSQAVLEHVDDVDGVYANLARWLKPDGVMSHRIDYTCHGITRDWFGHWTVPAGLWQVTRGRRAYFINRLPHSAQRAALAHQGFEILEDEPTLAERSAPLAEIKVTHTPEDLRIRGAFVVARRMD